MADASPRRRRVWQFGIAASGCVLLALAYGLHAARRNVVALDGVEIRFVGDAAARAAAGAKDHVVYRSTAVAEAHGTLVVSPLDDPSGPRYTTDLECERVDISGPTGVCLTANRGFAATYGAAIFDRSFRVRHRLKLTGIPSRTRVSPDGQLAAVTTFVSGHSYAGGAFSTRTVVIDTAAGREITELERFTVSRDGQPFKAVDFNFWGVTFGPDSNLFYATLGTGGRFLLIEGNARQQVARVLREGVECPSISPDGSRLAFKKRTHVEGRLIWRLAVMPLATLEERVVEGESRSIDDQVEWLDDDTLLYGVSDDQPGLGATSVWSVRINAGTPQRWLPGAFSPSVVRGRDGE